MYELDLQRQIDALKKQLDDLATRDRPGRLACLVYRNTGQSFTGAAALSWSSIRFDTSGGAMWAIANPTRLIAPVDGWYVIGSAFLYSSGQVSAGDVRIEGAHQLNGAANYLTGPCHGTFNAQDFRESWTSLAYLAKGEYAETIVNQGFGVSKTITAGSSTNVSPNSGWIVKVG